MAEKKNVDVYEIVTDRIIEELKKGNVPWMKPWVCVGKGFGKAVKHVDGTPYSLLNQLLLGKPGEYLSYKQAEKEGGRVKKGAKSKIVVFWKMKTYEEKNPDGTVKLDPKTGDPVTKTIPYLKYWPVFHIDDTEGIKEKYPETRTVTAPATWNAGVCEEAEKVLHDYIDREGITFEEEESSEAYYSPAADLIHLPARKQFCNTAEYYSTAFHEATHSTGHEKRLNRLKLTGKSAAFGGSDYGKEELVAELGAASICHALGIETDGSFKNSTAYIQNWLKALQNDQRLIVNAASKAEKAVALIFGPTDKQDEGEELPF